MKHSPEQQLYFLESLKPSLPDNQFLKMELRSRKRGMDHGTKKYLDQAEFEQMGQQLAKELLWTYIRADHIRSDNLHNAVEDVGIVIESIEDSIVLVEQLNEYLEKLELPKFD